MKALRPHLTALFFLSPFWAFANPQTAWEDACGHAKNLELPAQDRPDAKTLPMLKDCDSEALYYGIGQAADYQQAKACAYSELGKEESPFQGASILMMVYANGKGANRDYGLAIKLACAVDGAPAENEGRIGHLQQLRQQGPGTTDFDICDDITSGMMMGLCTAHNDRIEQVARTENWAALTRAWSQEEKNALSLLEKSARQFFQARSGNEIDQSGTARTAFVIAEDASLQDDLLSSLAAFEKGRLPSFTDQQFAAADAKLNAVYKKIQTDKGFSWGTVSKDGIKSTQRQWLKYRDAWVSFGKVKYPNVSAGSWKTFWTEKRTKMLEDFLQ